MVSLSRRELLALGAAAAVPGRAAEPPARSLVALTQGPERRQRTSPPRWSPSTNRSAPTQRKEVRPHQAKFRLRRSSTCGHARRRHPRQPGLSGARSRAVIIAEASRAGALSRGYETFLYNRLPANSAPKRSARGSSTRRPKSTRTRSWTANLHFTPVRLAARPFDPDAFVIGSAMPTGPQTTPSPLSRQEHGHGAPLHSGQQGNHRVARQDQFHAGYRQMHLNLLLTAKPCNPTGAPPVIDGFEGMEKRWPGERHPGRSQDLHRLHRLHRRRPRGRGGHGVQPRVGGIPLTTAPRRALGATTYRGSNCAATRTLPRSVRPTSCIRRSSSN